MARQVQKHEHNLRVISHRIDWTAVLVSCSVLQCTKLEVWTPATHRVKVADRKYRDQTPEEFREQYNQLIHICCG